MILVLVGLVFVACFGFVVAFGAPYVPSLRRDLEPALDKLYQVSPKDTVIDVGCGDGVVLRAVAKRGGRAIGYEINPVLFLLAKLLSRKDRLVQVKLQSFWSAQFPASTTLVYAFTVSRDSKRLASKLQNEANRLHKTLHLLSYGIDISSVDKVNQAGAYQLYRFTPLHKQKPQV